MPEGRTGLAVEASSSSPDFRAAPVVVRSFLTLVVVMALVVPFVSTVLDPHRPTLSHVVTAAMLVFVSVANVEIGRRLVGGLSHTQQPHKALSAWAFATALLLPIPWLLVVVPLTYAHARWRGLRVPLWKWVGSGAYLVLAGAAVVAVRHLALGESTDWMYADGGRAAVAMLLAVATFLAVESALFAASAFLGPPEDEAWLRQTLRGWSFYVTEVGVLLTGGLLAAVWHGAAWFVLFFLPIAALMQRAALHEPMRIKAEAAAELAARNRELELANQFKIDLLGVLGHEIGNPVTAILLHSEMAAEDLQTERGGVEEVAHALSVVERNALQIRAVLNDLLVLVTSDSGALRAHPEPTRVAPLLTAVVDSQPPGARPEVLCDPELRVLVQPGHLEQMVANLLGNATKYAGGAHAVEVASVDGGRVEIVVSDRGPGVPDSFRHKLFERFTREAALAGKVRGTGLGLFITRELARANGGDVIHRPARPSGSDFLIVLTEPVTPATTQQHRSETACASPR